VLLENQASLVLLVALVKSVAMVQLASEDNKAFAKLTNVKLQTSGPQM